MGKTWSRGINSRLPFGVNVNLNLSIDRDVLTTHCRSSSGYSVDLLSRTICTTVVVSDWCITNLAHGWWISIQGIVRGGN